MGTHRRTGSNLHLLSHLHGHSHSGQPCSQFRQFLSSEYLSNMDILRVMNSIVGSSAARASLQRRLYEPDIDNMDYDELLRLSESIGNVRPVNVPVSEEIVSQL